jgi:HUS1 checkpoint protein
MRFKANLINHADLVKLLICLEKFEKSCILKISKQRLLFISKTGFVDGVQIWSGCITTTMLSDCVVESIHKNEIYLHFDIKNLIRALRSAPNAQEIKIKLTKKSSPFLSIDMALDGLNITQDIPLINILNQEEITELVEPKLSNPTVSIMMPSLKDLKSIIDSMKTVDSYITLTATNARTLNFSVEGSMVSISTLFKSLEHPISESSRTQPFQMENEVRAVAKLDITKFQKFLSVAILNPLDTICSILEDKAVVLNCKLEDLYVCYYLPITHEK